MSTSPITTHVLDTARGTPASGLPITLARQDGDGSWQTLASGATDADGRIRDLWPEGRLAPGIYRMAFDTGTYFAALGIDGFYPEVTVVFRIQDPNQHYHVPLLLSPFGYSTYRGS